MIKSSFRSSRSVHEDAIELLVCIFLLCFALHAIVSHGDDVVGPTFGAWNLAVWQLSERFVACL